RVTRRCGADLGAGGVRRGVVRVAGHQRAGERRATVLRPVVAEPDRAGGDRGTERVDTVVVDPAVVIRAADHDLGVAGVPRHRGFVLTASRAGALGERRVGVRRARRERVVTYVAWCRGSIVTESHVGAGRGRQGKRSSEQDGNDDNTKRANSSHATPSTLSWLRGQPTVA